MSHVLRNQEIDHSDPRVRSGRVSWWHITSEYADVVDDIVETLAPEGPYAYSTYVQDPDGTAIPRVKIMTTREGIRQAYLNVHRYVAVREMRAIAEIRNDWYTFLYGVGYGLDKATGTISPTPTAVIFPTFGQLGITGELYWTRWRQGDVVLGGGELANQQAILAIHDRFVGYLRNAAIDDIIALTEPGAQTAVRDYVNDTGTLVESHDATELSHYLELFYARFRVHEVELIHRYVANWFVFAELRWVVEEVAKPGSVLTFDTAELMEIGPDGKVVARIGHGTGFDHSSQ